MIAAERFLVRSTEREAWLEARRGGVSATEVAAAATPSGFRETVERRRFPVDIEPNEFMQFGVEAEPVIMRYAHQEHGILPSDWLIASADDPRKFATPDGLSIDHTRIAEAKSTGKDCPRFEDIPIKYRRQVQWQLYVTGADECLFLWHLRAVDNHGDFYMPWLEPKHRWIERDEKEIRKLISVADQLLSLEDQ